MIDSVLTHRMKMASKLMQRGASRNRVERAKRAILKLREKYAPSKPE
jgi:hypothetical protein